ncbi:MAG: helix-turn-helix transcriptional regulator [Planctomycetes bacterium]|nr:helix-turn-helix transcriptional regulator [Planctomycetota bacterium]
MSETATKTPSKTGKSRRKKSRKKTGPKSKSPRLKVKRTKTTRKKKTASKAVRKTTSSARGGRRAPQGKRLGGWQLVKQADVFKYLSTSGTTIASLARTLGVGASAVHAWKASRRFPSEQAQMKLQQILSGELSPAPSKRKSAGGRRARTFNGKGFRQEREARGYSRARLSKQLGVSAGSIRNWEAGTSIPRGPNLAKCKAFLAEAPSAPAAGARASASTSGSATPSLNGGDGNTAVLGAVRVAEAYLSAGNSMGPDEVVRFVSSLRSALS